MVESERYKMIAPARVLPKALETGARNEERSRSAIRPASVYVFTQRFSLKIARLPLLDAFRTFLRSPSLDFRLHFQAFEGLKHVTNNLNSG